MTRPSAPYRGVVRTEVRDGQFAYKRQRSFAPPHRSRAIVWRECDQAIAIDRGYFLERETPTNRVNVRPFGAPNGVAYTDDAAVCSHLEQRAFHGDAFADLALRFIEQQDLFGWSGMWSRREIETASSTVRWYKEKKARARGEHNVLREHCRRAANARWDKHRLAQQQTGNHA